MTAPLVPVTFSVFGGSLYFYEAEESETTVEELIAAKFAKRWGGTNVTCEPTDVKGEFRVSGLFPPAFADARSYTHNGA